MAFDDNLRNLIAYAKTLKDKNNQTVFTSDDFENRFSNISIMSNYLAFAATLNENKARLYKDNSISSTTTDFDMARKLVKINNGHVWNRKQPAVLNCLMKLSLSTSEEETSVFGTSDGVTIYKGTSFEIDGVKFYLTDNITFSKPNTATPYELYAENPTGDTNIVLQQGELQTYNFTHSATTIYSFSNAENITYSDIFVERDGETIKYYADYEFIKLKENAKNNVYYVEFIGDNVVYKFNDLTAGDSVTIVNYYCEGFLNNFFTIMDETTSTNDISYNSLLSLEINQSTSLNGSEAETLDDLRKNATKLFIESAVTENDYNYLLNKKFSGGGYKLSAIGGENIDSKYIGYVIFTGINKQNKSLTIEEIQQVKTYLETVKGNNIRVIYKFPTIINIKYLINLRLHMQYRNRQSDYENLIESNIMSYINNEVYSDSFKSIKQYRLNSILLKDNSMLDQAESYNILQYPNIVIDTNMINFVNTIWNDDEPSKEALYDLYSFGTYTMTLDEIKELNTNLNYVTLADTRKYIHLTGNVYFDYNLSRLDLSNSKYNGTDLLKYAYLDKIALRDVPYQTNYDVIAYPEYEDDIIKSKTVDYSFYDPDLETSILHESPSDIYLEMKLFKNKAEEYNKNDIDFDRKVFIYTDEESITFG